MVLAKNTIIFVVVVNSFLSTMDVSLIKISIPFDVSDDFVQNIEPRCYAKLMIVGILQEND